MSETKFTKGEWYINQVGDSNWIDTQTGFSIANVIDESDAHLIAAAPEMYEAMQEFVNRCDNGEVSSVRTYNKFKSILAKARG